MITADARVANRHSRFLRSVLCSLVAATLGLAWPACGVESGAAPECVALLETRLGEREAASCVYAAARSEGGNGPAARLLERTASERSDLPWFSFYLGNLRFGDRELAIAAYERAAQGFASAGDTHGEIVTRLNRNQLLIELGRMDEARREIDRVTRLAEESDVPGDREWGSIGEARLLYRSGDDLARALQILQDLEIPAGVQDEAGLVRERLFYLGQIAMATGSFREARDSIEQLLDIAVAEGLGRLETSARSNLAWAAYEILREEPSRHHREEAVARAEEALAVARERGVSSSEALAAWFLGSLTPGEEGRRYLEECYSVAQTPDIRSHCLNALAASLVSSRPDRARELIDQSQALAAESESEWASIRVLQQSMSVDWATLSAEKALRSSWTTLSSIEALRDRQASGSAVQAGLFSVWSDEYAWLAGRLLKEAGEDLETERAVGEAFRVTERMRARALTDWLQPAEQRRVADSGEFASLTEIRSALEPQQALLSFQIAPWEDVTGAFLGGSWVLVVTRDRVTVHRLPGRVELRHAVRFFEGWIDRRDGAEAGEAVRLYDDLLAEALAALPAGVDRLILVPDDALHRLPFAALRASVDDEPLGARFELAQVPSATLWLRWRRAEPQPAERPLLVLADPQLPRGDAPEEFPLQVAQTRNAAETYGPLPWARREGRAAKRALGGGLLLTGPEASEAALRGLTLGDFQIFHVGAHAVTNEDRPERSAVLLAASPGGHEGAADGEDDPGDGYLRSAEIAHLDLDGRLVVLASCRSAGGSTLRGEGVMSLARAFFQAGAHGVVASLWPLRDDESAAMFERFYDHLGRGESVAAALRSARREAIEAGEPAAAWAGLVVLGDGSAVPLPGGRRLLDHPALPVVVPAALILAVVLLAVFAVRRRSAAPTA